MTAKDYIGKRVELFSGRVGVVTGIEKFGYKGKDEYLILNNEFEAKSDAGIEYVKQVLATLHKLVTPKNKRVYTWWDGINGIDKLKLSNKYFNTVPRHLTYKQIEELYNITTQLVFVKTPFTPTIKNLKNRLFTLTVVRIGREERDFQNTEVIGGIYSAKELVKEIKKKLSINELKKLINLGYGRNTCLQIDEDNHFWFCYVTRVK